MYQIIWFDIQVLFHAIQHFQTTALEIFVIMFVFLFKGELTVMLRASFHHPCLDQSQQ